MKGPKFRYESIDLMKLYATGNHVAWNAMLSNHLRKKDINGLAVMMYRLQRGMSDLAKTGHNTDKVCYWYLRLISSIDKTARRIVKLKHPNPYDNPMYNKGQVVDEKVRSVKKRRDEEMARFMRLSCF